MREEKDIFLALASYYFYLYMIDRKNEYLNQGLLFLSIALQYF